MTIAELLAGSIDATATPLDLLGRPVAGIQYDSRRVSAGDLFFAFAGAKTDGAKFATEAIARGAIAVVSEAGAPEGFPGPWIRVPHGRRALALAAGRLMGGSRLKLAGITGTNGKTTTSYLIDSIFRTAGFQTAMVGTIEYHVAGEVRPAVNTTPESLDLYRLFAEAAEMGATHGTMEVSSHALALGRVWGLSFHTAIFTNLTQDHLDFHGTMENYFGAKAELFRGQASDPPPHAVINFDDDWGRRLRLHPETRGWWYGLSTSASIRARHIETGFQGIDFEVVHERGLLSIRSPLVGTINVYNILAACATGLSFGLAPEVIEQGIANCRAVPGRFERVDAGQPFLVIVDYAHTDDALRNVIEAARSLRPRRVITLFGCGGDRDRTKRPRMAAAAARDSDYVVLTSDNPRSEDPLAIINDARVGLQRYDTAHHIEPDRALAIRHAIGRAEAGDIVLLTGKGHETYQVLGDQTIHFDDREVARQVLAERGA